MSPQFLYLICTFRHSYLDSKLCTYPCDPFIRSLTKLLQSIVHLVFRNQDTRKERDLWTYWYAQQPNANIRVFDVGKYSRTPIYRNARGKGFRPVNRGPVNRGPTVIITMMWVSSYNHEGYWILSSLFIISLSFVKNRGSASHRVSM